MIIKDMNETDQYEPGTNKSSERHLNTSSYDPFHKNNIPQQQTDVNIFSENNSKDQTDIRRGIGL